MSSPEQCLHCRVWAPREIAPASEIVVKALCGCDVPLCGRCARSEAVAAWLKYYASLCQPHRRARNDDAERLLSA